jgi:hypothetical protein
VFNSLRGGHLTYNRAVNASINTSTAVERYYAAPNMCLHCGGVIQIKESGGKYRVARARAKIYCNHTCEQAHRSALARLRPIPDAKICRACKSEKPLDQFHRCVKSPDGRANVCAQCRKAVDGRKFSRRTKEQKARYLLAERARQALVRAYVVEYLQSHPCVDCRESDPIVLEFDHVRGTKRGDVAQMIRACSLERVKEEIAKCDVRCANCHRRATAKRGGWSKIALLKAGETLTSEAPLGTREEVGASPTAGTNTPVTHR